MPIRRHGFNLVEILITLTIVALLTTVVVSAVSDYKDKLRMVVVKNDLMTLAQMCKYVESTEKTLVQTISDGATEITTELNNYIIKIPSEDPWGRQYLQSADGSVATTDSGGQAYLIDRGMGRIISPGPDGVCNTTIGSGLSDVDRDIVVEYRQKQWIIYNLNDKIYLAKGDGGMEPIWLYDGKYMDVSPDRQTFACLDVATLELTWGRVDENPQVNQTVKDANGATSTWTGDSGSFPFFAPDGVHIIITRDDGGGRNLYCINTNTGLLTQLTNDGPIYHDADYYTGQPMTKPRTVFNDGRSSFYHFVDQGTDPGVFIAVSSDGKIAFHNNNAGNDGMDIVLLNGTGRRTIIKDTAGTGKRYRPIAWLDTETLVYVDKGYGTLYRIKQDGSYNVALYPSLQGEDTTDDGPFKSFSPSPDRQMIGFVCKGTGGNGTGYRIIRTDGSGCILNSGGSAPQSELSTGTGALAPALWPNRGRRMGAEYRRSILISLTDPTSDDLMQELEIVETGSRVFHMGVSPVVANSNQGMVPLSWDVDASGNLIALVSLAGGAAQRDGVFVFSVAGPYGAVTDITKNMPAAEREPDVDKFFSIFWIQ